MSNANSTNKYYTIFLSILPLIVMYRVPGTSLAMATVLTFLGLIFATMSLLKRKIRVPFSIIFPLILYFFYVTTRSTWQFTVLIIAVFIHILAITTGVVDERLFRKIIERVAVIAAICVFIQQLLNIGFGMKIPFVIGDLFIETVKEQYWKLLSGEGASNMYRPCAFFLEPSHYSQYCILGLGSCLFSNQPNLRKALVISLGILMCTSGMGLVATIAMWGIWKFTQTSLGSLGIIFKKSIIVVLLLVISVFILDQISFTHNIISRLTADPESGDYNAINGRLWWWDAIFGNLGISDIIWGFGMENLPEDAYLTGFMKQLYCYGIIGCSFLFFFLINLIFRTSLLGKACTAIYTGLLFFADLTGYVSLLFYIGTFLILYMNKSIISYRYSTDVISIRR